MTLHRTALAALALWPLLLFSQALCQDTGVSLTGDDIFYRKEQGLVEARGSVEASYKDIKVLSNHLIYYSKDGRIVAPEDFTFERQDVVLKGKDLDYNIKSKEGRAASVSMVLKGNWISGKDVIIKPEEISLSDASFSTCGLKEPHYKFTAQNLSLYPKQGWIVIYMGVLWVKGFPIAPVPTYVYDMTSVPGFASKNKVPLPEFGVDPDDGAYLKQKLFWRLSGFSYGMAQVDYATKKGLGLGFEGNYVVDRSNQGNIRIHGLNADGYWGGITHSLFFGSDIKYEESKTFLYQLLEFLPRKKYELRTEVSYRERVNYEKVSLLPKVSLRYDDLPFSFLELRPSVEISLAGVSEESTGVGVFEGTFKSSVNYFHELPRGFWADLAASVDYRGYDSSSRWLRLDGSIDIFKPVNDRLDAGIGYGHLFINDGASPYRFERYRFFPYDDVRGNLRYKNGPFKAGVFISYNVPVLTPREIDYNATMELHCFDVTLLYRAMRGEFSVGLNLVSK
ncbi:MAG: hypothetical protein WC490_07010 [Candidatus Margulisiibacteriota bacterium]